MSRFDTLRVPAPDESDDPETPDLWQRIEAATDRAAYEAMQRRARATFFEEGSR